MAALRAILFAPHQSIQVVSECVQEGVCYDRLLPFVRRLYQQHPRSKLQLKNFANHALIRVALLFTFSQLVDNESTDLRTMFMFLCPFPDILFLLSRNGSTLVTVGTGLEVYLMKKVPDHDPPDHVNLFGSPRFREGWDTSQFLGFSLTAPNLRFVAFCVTCVTMVLQFDYGIVRALNRLSSPP